MERVDPAADEQLGGGEGTVDFQKGNVGEERQLTFIVDQHGYVRLRGQGSYEAGAVTADPVMVVGPGKPRINGNFQFQVHRLRSLRKLMISSAAVSGVS